MIMHRKIVENTIATIVHVIIKISTGMNHAWMTVSSVIIEDEDGNGDDILLRRDVLNEVEK